MEILALLGTTITDTVLNIAQLGLLLVPIMVLIELARHYQLIEKITDRVRGALQFLTLPQEAAFPILVGLFFGIVFGSALIIDYAKEGILKKRDLLLIGIFLCISHSVVEDTLILSFFGANPFIVVGVRTILAIIITRMAASLLNRFSLVEG